MEKINQIKEYFQKNNLDKIILIVSFLIIIVGAFIVHNRDPRRFTDENSHTLQTKRIYRGENRPVKQLTTIPGYHYTLAFIGRLADPFIDYKAEHPKDHMLRLFQATLSLLLPLVLFFIIRKLKQNSRSILIILLVPIIFPFLFLIYTEVWSLSIVLLAFLFYIYKRYDASAIFILLSVLVRQDNIIWLGFLATLLLWDVFVENDKNINKKFFIEFFTKGSIYLVVLILFIAFYIFNGGVAIGDKSKHPSMSFHFENIYLFLMLFSSLFLPVIIANIKKVYKFYFGTIKRLIISLILIFSGYFVFIKTLVLEPHPYSKSLKFIHNILLHNLQENIVYSIIAYIFILLTIGYFFTKPFINKKYSLILPFSVIFLLMHWLFEFRYSVIPLVLTFVFLKHNNKSLNYQIVYGGVFSLIIFYVLFVSKSIDIFL